ncbi:DUF3267 domain-containing protein [Haloarchaeobius sp. HRN-SO-5]|uniref:DUF3267 domain-containing protein n=1 Tax=Haloarchaeobius sp. HRN-SO-5 TaxID=3446118 RepID=UPI003EB6B720
MSSAPDPPTGFAKPESYNENSARKRNISIGSGILALVALFVAFPILGALDSSLETVLDQHSIPVAVAGIGVASILTVTLTIGVHEYIHFFADRLFGYDPIIEFGLPNPYVVTLQEFKNRNHSAISLIAPLLVIDIAALGLLQMQVSPLLTYSAVFALMLNTGASGSDIYGFLFLLSVPSGTMLYSVADSDEIETYVYPPS